MEVHHHQQVSVNGYVSEDGRQYSLMELECECEVDID